MKGDEKIKRADAFRKVQTICQRLDEVDPKTFYIEPLKLYLYGSLLTDKPNPRDIDLVLVYNFGGTVNVERDVVMPMSYGQPLPFDRARTHLRRGMKMVSLEPAHRSLDGWQNYYVLLAGGRLQLIWKPGFEWTTALAEIKSKPRPWEGPRSPEAREEFQAWADAMPGEERKAKLAEALAEIEVQG